MALIYEDLGVHPKHPTARLIVSYDSHGCGKAYLYRGYRNGSNRVTLYPDDAETYRESGKKRIRWDQLKKKEKAPTVAGTTAGAGTRI